MKKQFLVAALALATVLCTTNAFAVAPCTVAGTNGLAVVPQVVAVGSSAQANTFAYAVAELLTAQAGDTGIVSSDYNLYSASGGVAINDTRVTSTTVGDGVNPAIWIWDNNTTCNLYAYYSTDSGVGVKDFLATKKAGTTSPASGYYIGAAVVSIGTPTGGGIGSGQVKGLGDNVNSLPANVKTFFNTPWVPTFSGTTLTNAPLPYCGWTGTGTPPKAFGWCVFNMAATDIRPEDALYAATRALTTLNTGTYAGLGYNNAGCQAGTTSGPNGAIAANVQGCPIFDSFGQGKIFNVLSFKLTGADPITSATVPPYLTISTGASPVLVFVNNSDTAGFGSTTTSGSYVYNNIDRGVLSQVFSGTLHCTGDLLPNVPGSGRPMQEVQREPLSGTYNTFEFTAVRTLSGSSNGATTNPSATAWKSNDDNSQEYRVDPSVNFANSSCGVTTTGSYVIGQSVLKVAPDGTIACGDPIFITPGSASVTCNSANTNPTDSLRLRSIGTGVEVAGTLGLDNKGASQVTDGIGYAFWSYGNFAPAAITTSCNTNGSGQYTTCTNIGHYLTVDGVDPLFNNPGDSSNPNGAYNLPQCNFGALPCFKIPFTHVFDGSYPLWSLLRVMTFKPATGLQVPTAVKQVVAYEQFEASTNDRLSDFVPFLTNVNVSTFKGDLNLGVFRSHYKQTNNPNNGHAACNSTYTGISIGAASGCLVDVGGDVGGTVLTVQADSDFNDDFGTLFLSGNYELYNLRQ